MLAVLGLAAVPAGVRAEGLTLPVPTSTIYAGDFVKAGMVREQHYPDTYHPRTPVVATAVEAVGRVARRTLLPGETIPATALDEARLVTRGVPTQILFEEDGLTIVTTGLALANGGVNDTVRVRNAATGRIIQGIVQADGRVRVGMP
ncbi:flagellar basal body P-ring formation chaperone FlgA [Methylobacterium sp. 1030]|uniref:flagellar basal body P-ring formation chaperone FlgA n=1 Tax=Methylobacterium sp. 1030 TaxID=3156404 RepID=UPI003393DD20